MSEVFSFLLLVYVAHALLNNRQPDQQRTAAVKWAVVVIHLLLFVVACWIGAREGVFSRALLSPVHIGAGLLAGHLIFGVSLLLTHLSWRAAAGHFLDLRPLWDYGADHPEILSRFVIVAAGEELIYRVAAQSLAITYTGSSAAGIIIVAGLFSVVHKHFFKNTVGQSAEFVVFAVALGVLYYWTGSLILVLVIHAVRNIEIAYLEYIVESEEDDSAAPLSQETKPACATSAAGRL